jgi:hypothetical protein
LCTDHSSACSNVSCELMVCEITEGGSRCVVYSNVKRNNGLIHDCPEIKTCL